jgi:hypothetical protein
MYKYEVNAKCYFEKINLEDNFDKKEFEYNVEDMICEIFYHGDEKFIHTYSAKFKIDLDNSFYTIKYYVYSKTKDLMEDFKTEYNKEIFDINNLICIGGIYEREFYLDNKINKLLIKNIELEHICKNISKKYIIENDDYLDISDSE